MKSFKGSGVALVTPFQTDGSIDFQALKQLVQLQIEGGTDFLVVQGTTGESPTLSQDEKRLVLDTVLEVNNGRLPVVYGIGGNNTAGLAALFQNLPSGVDGILSVSPYYNKPIQKGIVAHFKQVASYTDLPIILYNVPGRTGSNMSVETTLELAELPNVVAVKEASGNMEQIMDIIRQRKPGFGVLSGDDNLTMPLIAAGADGVISVVANAFPERFSQMVHASMANDLTLAKAAHYDLFNVTKMFFEEGNPGGVKVALAARGLMQETMRLPLYPVSEGLRTRIQAETTRLLASL
jgi:4-hydroxy-tetrahydrodipicolinate synthase